MVNPNNDYLFEKKKKLQQVDFGDSSSEENEEKSDSELRYRIGHGIVFFKKFNQNHAHDHFMYIKYMYNSFNNKKIGASRRALHLISRSQKATKSAYACFIVEAFRCSLYGTPLTDYVVYGRSFT